MIAWLFHMADSATSLACLMIAICIFSVGRFSALVSKPQRILPLGIASIILFLAVNYAFDVKNTIIYMLGRKPNLTDRFYIWDYFLAMVRNPVIGYGFESFYLSDGLNIRQLYRSTHNGYPEMYLNLGMVGVGFVIGWIVSGMKKAHNYLFIDYSAAMLRISLIVVVSLYNWTESTFAGVNNMLIILLFAIMSIPYEEKYEFIINKDQNYIEKRVMQS